MASHPGSHGYTANEALLDFAALALARVREAVLFYLVGLFLDEYILSTPSHSPYLMVGIGLLCLHSKHLYQVIIGSIVSPLLGAIYRPIIPFCNRALVILRTRTLPFLGLHILRQTPPRTIAIPYIVENIMSYLPRHDLTQCCRVSHLFLDIGSRHLYGDIRGILATKERHYRWTQESGASPGYAIVPGPRPSVLGGEWGDASDTSPLDGIPSTFRISPLKRHLLRHVRHLIYHTDFFREYDTISSTGLFPLLNALTIQSVGHWITWDGPFLARLTPPRHIRLTHIRGLGTSYTEPSYPLNSTLGSRANKVTIHFLDCDPILHGNDGMAITWPSKLDQIDLVFMSPVADPRIGSQADHPLLSISPHLPPIIPADKLEAAVEVVAKLMASASSSGAQIRVVGLGRRLTKTEITLSATEAKGTEEDEGGCFARRLTAQYAAKLSEKGMKAVEVEKKVEELDFVPLWEYTREPGYIPF